MCQVSSVWLSPIRNKIEGNFTPLKSKYEVKMEGGNGLTIKTPSVMNKHYFYSSLVSKKLRFKSNLKKVL